MTWPTGYRYCVEHGSMEIDETGVCSYAVSEAALTNNEPCDLVPTHVGGVVARGDGPVVGEGSVPPPLPDVGTAVFESVKVMTIGPASRLLVTIPDDWTREECGWARDTIAAWAGITPDRVLLSSGVEVAVVEPGPVVALPVEPQFEGDAGR